MNSKNDLSRSLNKLAAIAELSQTTDKMFTLNWFSELKELSKITESPELTYSQWMT
jgi:hypothetical protein